MAFDLGAFLHAALGDVGRGTQALINHPQASKPSAPTTAPPMPMPIHPLLAHVMPQATAIPQHPAVQHINMLYHAIAPLQAQTNDFGDLTARRAIQPQGWPVDGSPSNYSHNNPAYAQNYQAAPQFAPQLLATHFTPSPRPKPVGV